MYFQDNHIAIPAEVALVGFSNNPNTLLVRPRLTTVNQPAFTIGQSAAKMMLAQLNPKNESKNRQTVVLKTRLIVRDSS
jgi:LacI family transcriptional regulator